MCPMCAAAVAASAQLWFLISEVHWFSGSVHRCALLSPKAADAALVAHYCLLISAVYLPNQLLRSWRRKSHQR